MRKSFKRVALGVGVPALFLVALLAQPKLADLSQSARTGHNVGITTPLEPAYINHGDTAHNNIVAQGELFFVRHHFRKLMECRVNTTRYFYNDKNHIHYSFGTTTTAWMLAGDYDYNEAYTMPDNIPPGEYNFRTNTISHCAGQDYYTTSFDVKVVVVPAKGLPLCGHSPYSGTLPDEG